MLPIKPSSILPLPRPHTLPLAAPIAAFRFRAAADNTFPRSVFNFPTSADAAAGRIEADSIGSTSAGAVNGNKSSKREKWSRHRESYLIDDEEPLPLPMTCPNSKPAPPEVVFERLNCDPVVMDCKAMVYEWTGKCRSCQGTGLVSYYNKRGKETICKCIPCQGIGYVQKITARTEIDVMEDLDNGKPQ